MQILTLTDEIFGQTVSFPPTHPPPLYYEVEGKDRKQSKWDRFLSLHLTKTQTYWSDRAAPPAHQPPSIHLSIRLSSLLFGALHLQTWKSSKRQTRCPEVSPPPSSQRCSGGTLLTSASACLFT